MERARQNKLWIAFVAMLAFALVFAMASALMSPATETAHAEHEHDFTYVASGAKITATCNNPGCTLTEDDLTLEILPPTDLAWSATKLFRPTLSGQNDTVFPLAVGMGSPFGPPQVTRSGNPTTIWRGGDNGITGPGTYTATATIGGATASLEFTVTKSARSAIVVTMEGWREDKEAKNPSISAPNGDTRDFDKVTYAYKVKDADDSTYTATKPTTPGEYTVKATIPETDTYLSISATTDFTITEAPDEDNYEHARPIVLGEFYYQGEIIDFGPYGQWITDEYGTRLCKKTYQAFITGYPYWGLRGQVEDEWGMREIDDWYYEEIITDTDELKVEVIGGDGTQENPWRIREYFLTNSSGGSGSGSGGSGSGGSGGSGETPAVQHTHNFIYVANGATITATCNGEGSCDITSGLTLTISAPDRLDYDGNAKAAYLSDFNTTAFPGEHTITYFKGGVPVSAENVKEKGTYVANVSQGTATASVSFTIKKMLKDPETPEVVVEVVGVDEIDDSIYKLEVKLETEKIDEVPEQMAEYVNEKEEIALVYDVKLWKITSEGGVEKKELIQPTDIAGATSIIVSMEIPDEIKGKAFRLYHIHNDSEITQVTEYKMSESGDYLSVNTDKLSEFAFVIARDDIANKDGHGSFCIAWIVFIFVMLELLYLALYLILWFPQAKMVVEKCKLGTMKKNLRKYILFGFINLLLLIGLAASAAIFLFALIVICVHVCPVSIISFILATLILAAFIVLLFLGKHKKEDEDNFVDVEPEEIEESGEGLGLKDALAMAAAVTRTEKITKKYVADYLDGKFGEEVQTNRRENLTSTGLPLADTHYAVAKRKACFVFVYEVNDTVMMQMKVTDELGKEFSKGHTTVHKSAFPKSKDSWYSVIVDDSFTNADVEKMLDECFLQVKETLPKKV